MKHAEFMSSIVGYYGAYENKFVEGIILKKIATFPEKDLEPIFQKILSEIPRRGDGQNPIDIARLNSLFIKSDRDYEAEAHEWWNTITRTGCSLDDVVISDLRAQACIEDFGGWSEFCQRDPQYESLHQQKFIKWFVMYSHKLPDREAKVLLGDSTRRREPLMFGLKDECKAIAMSARPEGSVLQLADTLTRDMRIGNEH
jgi:hypothetical protein